MTETIGYLVLSTHANSFLGATLWLVALGSLFYIMLFTAITDKPLSRFINTIFTFLSAIAFVTILASLSSSWSYQTRAIETCSKDPSCDYALANKAARDIVSSINIDSSAPTGVVSPANLGTTISEQQ